MTREKPLDLSPLFNRYRLFILMVGSFAALTIGFYIFAYTQLRELRVLLVPAIILALVVILGPLVVFSITRERGTLAGSLILAGLALAYGGNELAWDGLAPYHIAGGLLLLVLAGNFVLPRRYGIWMLVGVLYVLYILGINRLPGLVRFEVSDFSIMLPFALGANLMLVLAILGQVLVEFQARSIRARLLGTFVLIVILPVIVIGSITSLLSATNNSRQVYNQLDSVTSLKVIQLENWLKVLQQTLGAAVANPADVSSIQQLLDQNNTGAAQEVEIRQKFEALVSSRVGLREVFLLNPEGEVIFSTETRRRGSDEQTAPYLVPALAGPTFSPVYFSETFGENVIVVALPVLAQTRQVIGVIAGRADLNQVTSILAQRNGLGNTGESFLVTGDRQLLTPSDYAGYIIGQRISSPAINEVTSRGMEGETLIITGGSISYHTDLVLGYYRWLPSLRVAIASEQAQSEALASTYQFVVLTVVLSLLSVIAAFLVGLYVTRRITRPLASLAQTAEHIAAGDLSLAAEESELAELNTLARSFNTMTGQLRSLVVDLEKRVMDRTQDLERRSQQLQIAADVAREATSIRDLDELLNRTVYLVRERFGYYHVGLFLLDERQDYAVLVAATGDAGRRMLNRNHRLRVGETGMVGFVARTGIARIAADVTQDSTHYINPDLPDTRAEAALPLKAGMQVIGVLDVQSTREGAFTSELLEVLQVVADQFAVAIESARLLRQTRATLRQLQSVTGSYTLDAWRAAQQRLGKVVGYRYQGLRTDPIEEADRVTARLVHKHVIPLRLRDQVIGEVEMQFTEPPTKEALLVFNEIGTRLALLLENARLVQEAKNLATREQQINVITNQVRSSLNLDAILRSTVKELGAAFGASRTFVQLNPVYRLEPEDDVESSGEDGNENNGHESSSLEGNDPGVTGIDDMSTRNNGHEGDL